MSKKATPKLLKGKELVRLFETARKELEMQQKIRAAWKKKLSKRNLKEIEKEEKKRKKAWKAMIWEPELLLMAAEGYRNMRKKDKW